MISRGGLWSDSPLSSPAAFLTELNAEQRQAVEYGARVDGAPGPLLVIAGAGSGKTNTLAYRVAHMRRYRFG
jgi:DNA helicase II / ATP-dependent DNA helicase PcrA